MAADPVALYHLLLTAYGRQRWWPAQEAFEMMVGAILVQNTAWRQVEIALSNLRRQGLLVPAALRACSEESLGQWIRPAGYFRVKAERLQALVRFLSGFGDDPEALFALPTPLLREKLLAVRGIGPETADSILCYGGARAVLVVDAYARRLFFRLGWLPERASYQRIQAWCMERLPRQADLLAECHALIVRHAKNHCRARPLCAGCPVGDCPFPRG